MDKIQEQFNQVIMYSQNLNTVNSELLFAKWKKNKQWFIDANDGNLIYEYPEKVTFKLSESDKKIRIENFISNCANFHLAAFLKKNQQSFFENKLMNDYDFNGIKIPKGMKISKAMKFFEPDPVYLDEYQTKMSMLLQEEKIEGTLCFSVHPLDYLSLSENTYKWRSCHALDGDYRSGNLSYMLDSTTIICYLRGEKEAKLPNFPDEVKWNSKKWRMLLFVPEDQNYMFAGRQYPFTHDAILSTIKDIITTKIFKQNGWYSNWTDWYNYQTVNIETKNSDGHKCFIPLNNKYILLGNSLIPLNDIVKNAKYSHHYNDVLYSSYYTPYYCWRSTFSPNNYKPLIIGSSVPCLICGQGYTFDGWSVLCHDCELEYGTEENDSICYCADCGERIYYDDAIYVEDVGYVCGDCIDNYVQCDCCGYYFSNDYIIHDSETDQCLCRDCYNSYD